MNERMLIKEFVKDMTLEWHNYAQSRLRGVSYWTSMIVIGMGLLMRPFFTTWFADPAVPIFHAISKKERMKTDFLSSTRINGTMLLF